MSIYDLSYPIPLSFMIGSMLIVTRAGAFWFTRLCAALDADAGDTFRGWLADLCPELLQGNFNHTSRQAAGLQRSWCNAFLRHLAKEGTLRFTLLIKACLPTQV